VFFNRDLTVSTKVAVYKAICLSILLCRCESWIPYRRHIKALEAYHVCCLQSILGIRWWHRKTHTEIRETCKIESVELLLLQRQRLPCCLLSGELQLGQRPVGRPKLRYSDHIKSVLRKCNITESQLEAHAEDRVLWVTCATGLKNLAAAAEQAASGRRARRHAAATATPAGPVCPHCGRICASDFGLRSHLRVHL